jgi:protein TonB
MTVPFPLDAFEDAKLLALPRRVQRDRSRAVAIVLTVVLHVVIVAGALSLVHVAHRAVPQLLVVQITPEKHMVEDVVAPAPPLAQPTIINVPMPQVVVETPAPVIAARPPAPVPVSAPPAPAAPAHKAVGEGRASFLTRLLAQLNRFKQYPRAARQAHIQGVVMLHFVMNAQGRVTAFDVAKSSGHPVLDAEALALIQRAQPLPAIPPDYPDRTLDAIVPIEFSLNR